MTFERHLTDAQNVADNLDQLKSPLDTMRQCHTLIAIFTVSLVGGCANTHDVSLLTPDKRETLLNSSQTVVKGTITEANLAAADLTLSENYLQPYPANPKNGYKHDFTITVDSVIKGDFTGKVLHLHDLKDPNQPGIGNPNLWLGIGQKVYVGWRSESGGNYTGLMMVNAEKVPTTAP